jgi:hypothetical protein
MTVHFVAAYAGGLAGMVVGAAAGLVTAMTVRRADAWDARLTLPLVLAAGAAHVSLIPVVEPQRQIMFGLYFLAMTGVFVLGLLRVSIWRLGAVLFPSGSIAAYFYFAFIVHQADYIGLSVKLVELAVIIAALVPVLGGKREREGRQTLA